jgi:hypothetical protein
MADPHGLLREAVEAIVVRPPLSFSWFGAIAGAIPPRVRRGLTEAQLRLDLEERLARTLYAGFYSRGSAAPIPVSNAGSRPDDSFVRALSRANRGVGCSDPGWRVLARNGSWAVVTKGGLAFTAANAPSSGSRVTVRLSNERLRLAPGFYMAIGDRPLDMRHRFVRVYWNIDSAGAAPLVAAVTGLLNERGIPFRLKVANRPDEFARCDAAVLYARRSDRALVWPIVDRVRLRLSSRLGLSVPAFTKSIAPGLAVAEEPPAGESFGMSRCRIVASALVRAATGNARGTEERMLAIEHGFAERGLDLRRPFLNARSRDVYPSLTR